MAFPSNSQFQPILIGNQPIFDMVGDQSPSSTDLVGNTQFPAAFFAYDATNVYFRIRVNEDPRNSKLTGFANYGWGVLINTSGDPGVYDWLANVNGLDNTINLIKNTTRVYNSWNDPAEGTDGRGAPNFSRPIVNFDVARATLTNDGSNFGGNPDYFIDFQFPVANFFSLLGITASTPIGLVIFTSANANNYNKDSLQAGENFQFVQSITNPTPPTDVDVRAALTATKTITSGPTSLLTGSLTTWTQRITVTNTGRDIARSVVASDVFGIDQLSSVSNITVSSGSATLNAANKTLTWNIGNLTAGQSVTLTYTVIGTFSAAGTRRLNTVTVSGTDNFTGSQLTPVTAANDVTVAAAAAITGRVTSGRTGLPLSGVTVELRNQSNVLISTTTTNTEGNYSFTQLAAGTYNLNFAASSFITATRTTTLTDGQTQVLNVILQPQPGNVTGTVLSQDGTPVNGATIRLIDQFNTVITTVTTNAQGQYTISNVTPGQYSLTVSASNFQSQSRGVTINAGQTTVSNFTLIPSPGTVTGTITGSAGTPIEGAVIEVLDSGSNVIASTTSNAQGQYTINQLAPGTFRLRATAQNFQTSLLGFSIQAGQTTTQNIVLQPSPGILTGTLTDAQTGPPLIGGSVNVVNQAGVTIATATTNAQGQYTIANLAPGNYTVTFGQQGYASQTVGTVIRANTTTTLSTALNQNVGVIAGTVTNNQGTPLIGTVINVFLNNNLVASVNTNETGTYTIPNLAPGNYTVNALAQNFQSQVKGAQVSAFQTTTVNFALIPDPGVLTGTIIDTNGNTVSGTIINVRTNAGGAVIGNAVSDQSGLYTVPNLAPGNYIVTATAPNLQTASQGTTIPSNQTTTLNFTLAFSPVTITGIILNQQTGESIAGAQIQVRILDANGAVVANVLANQQGIFEVPQLAPGTYTIFATAPNFQTNFASVNVPPGSQPNIQISLVPSPGYIVGQVVNTITGDPIGGATISVVNQNNIQLKTVLTDSQGNYTIEGLPPGSYNLVVSATDFQSNVTGAIVLANSTTTANIALSLSPGAIIGNISPNQSNTVVELYTTNNIFIQSTVADNNGNYQFLNLAPGNYIVKAQSPNFITQSTGAVVSPNVSTTVNLTLPPNPASIEGVVLDANERPISNAIVQVLDANDTIIGTAGTDSNGNYSIGNLPPGSFTTVVTAPSFGTQIGGVTLQPGDFLSGVNFSLVPNPGGISGLITNETNGEPLTDAAVIIRQTIGSSTAIATVTTDSSGNFLVQGLAPGSYTVTASSPGFGTETIGAVVASDSTSTANIALNELSGSIRGQFTDPQGNPINGQNLQIRLLDQNGVLLLTELAQTDGIFVFSNISPGNYILNATAPGFQSNTVGIQVFRDQETATLIPLEPSPATLTGQVINEQTLTGLPGSIISVINSNTGLLVGKVTSGQDGTFILENLPAGSFTVTANAQNFGNDSKAIILNAGQTTNTTLMLTSNPGRVSGFIVNRINGEQLPAASIQIFDQTGAAVVSVVSDPTGEFLVSSLAPGQYTAIATSQGFTSGIISFTIIADTQSIASFALEPNPSSITGQVIDIATGQPIVGADVIVRQFTSTGPIISTTQTDSNGSYILSNLPQGSFTVIVIDPDYSSQSSSVTLTPGARSNLNFNLQQLPSSIQGNIINQDTSEPLINTLVQLIDNNGILITQAQTDINGFYQITGFSAGQYTLSFINPLFQSQTVSFISEPGETSVINVELISNPGAITGQIFDSQTLAPLIGASVRVFPASSLIPIATLVTDGTGQYFLTGLSPGTYTLTASFETYASSSTGVTVLSNQTISSDIILTPDPSTVSGTITSDTGSPIPNATVRILDQNETVLATVVTDELGNYSVTNLPQGNQKIIVTAPGFATQLGGVILTPGQVATGTNFILTANVGSITGQIVSAATGTPIIGAIAVVRTVAGIPVVVASTTTDEVGNYTVTGLQPGSYEITGSATDFALNTVGAIVVSDQVTQADITLSPLAGTISGNIIDIQGSPVTGPNIQLRVFDQSGLLLQTLVAQSDGSFLINNLPPGSYQLTILAPNFEATTVGAVVAAGQITTLTVPLTPNPGTIRGQVINEVTGDAVTNAIISITNINGLPIGSAVTDSNGNFSIPNLPPTTVTVSAVAPDFGSSSRSVILTSGETVITTLSLAPNPGTINGIITSEQTGEVIVGATIQIFDFTSALIATVVSDSNGSYQFVGLTPGLYQVVSSAKNFGSSVRDAQVFSNQTTTGNFSLAPNPGSIFGALVNEQTGEFIVGATIVVRQFSPTGPIVQTIPTDSSGQFTVLNLEPGTYTVTAYNPNFGTQSATVLVQSNVLSTVSLTLTPNPGTIEGQITSVQTGTPLVDTQVRVIDNNGALVAVIQTDINGNYSLQGLKPGTYTIVFLNTAFQSQTFGFTVGAGDVYTLNAALEPNPGFITGTVFDSQSGTTLAGAAVQVFPSQSLIPIASAVTDQSGSYNVIGLEPGEYTVVANAQNYARAVIGATVFSNETTVANLLLLPNPATVSGTISTPDGIPIPGAIIRIVDQSENLLGTGITDQNGLFTIGNIPPGFQNVIISADGFSNQLIGIALGPGELITDFSSQLTPNPGSLDGIIINEQTGESIAGANVIIRRAGTTSIIVANTTTDLQGNYRLDNLSPGSYLVTATEPGFGTNTVGVIIISDTVATANVLLTPLTGSITGTVVDPQGNPITGNNIQIQVFDQNGTLLKSLTANNTGSFTILDLAPGSYGLTVTAPNFATNTLSANIVSEQITDVTAVLQPNPASIFGQVTNQTTGEPVGGAIVTVTLPNGIVVGGTVTDQNGSFVVNNLPPQTLVISIAADNYGSSSQSIILTPGQSTETNISLLPSVGVLRGTVFNEQTEQPIAGVTLEVFDFTRGMIATVVTDTFGFYEVPNLFPGLYRLIATAKGYGAIVQEVSISVNQETVLNFFLPPNPGTIQGTITNRQTGEALLGASIIIRQFSPTGPIIASLSTDQNGQFVINNLAPGSYAVVALDPDFGSQAASVFVESDTVSSISISLVPNPGIVQGIISNEQTGEPLTNAFVRVLDNNRVIIQEVQTDTTGAYRVEGLSPGEYLLIAVSPNFQRESVGFIIASGDINEVNVALQPNPGSISGRVTNKQTALPLDGATVQVFPAQSLIPIANAVTDQNGTYQIPGLAPGEYIVVANARDYARATVGAIVAADQTTMADLQLSLNPATISGTVTDSQGNPIENATVRVIDQNETVLGTALTDQNGNYVISNLPPGSQTIIVTAPTFSSQVSGVTLGAGALENVSLGLTENPGIITGQITNGQTGDPIVGSIVLLRTSGGIGLIVGFDITDENGTYFITGIAPGMYTVLATANGFGISSVGAIVQSDITTNADIALVPNAGAITGLITNLQGSPILGTDTQIEVFDQGGTLLKTLLAQSDGTFAVLDLPPGSYNLLVTAPNFAAQTTSTVIVSDQTNELNILLTPNPASITGRVLNVATGFPINGAILTVTDSSGIVVGSGTSGVDGDFTINNLPPSTLIISAVAQTFGSDSKAVILTPGGEGTTTLTLTPNPGVLQGTVINQRTGQVIPGTTLQIFDSTRALVATVQTDQNGFYQIQTLSPGSYRVIATIQNFGSVSGDTQVNPEATTELNFTLVPNPGTITGVIYNEQTGSPIAGASIAVRQFSPVGPIIATTTTDSRGQFTVLNLTPGAYTIVVSEPNFGSQASSTLVQSDQVSTVLVNLPPNPGTIQGVVTSEQTGQPIVNTLIRVVDVNGITITVTQTDISGNFQAQGLAPGTYSLIATNPEFQGETVGFSIGPNQTITQNISLAPNPGILTGTVSDLQTGVSLAGAVVQIFSAGNLIPIENAITNQNGSFIVRGLEPGEYNVLARATNFGSVVVGATITPGDTTNITISLAPLSGSISGQVTDFSGNPLSNATLRLLDRNQNVVGIGATDISGAYTISNIAPGTYILVASAPGFGTSNQGITVGPEQFLTGINIPLEANPGNITGQVVSADTGKPVIGATVTVRSLQAIGGIAVQVANTDQQGNYVVSNLSPGSYSVTVTQLGFGLQTKVVTVFSNQATNADFTLILDTGNISGLVSDTSGNPITGSNIFIRLFDENQLLIQSITALPNGTFTISNLAPGSYSISAEASDFGVNTLSTIVVANQTTSVTIPLTPTPATVTGQVSSQQTSTSLQGVSVTAVINGQVSANTVTDLNGNFQLTNLPAGEVTIIISTSNFATETQTLTLTPGETVFRDVSLTPLPGTITGTITNEQTGAPVQDAIITVRQFSPAGPIVTNTITNTQGQFSTINLPPGTYTIIAEATNLGTTSATTVVVPNTSSTVNIGLAPNPGTIQGTITAAGTGSPVPESRVQVIRKDGTIVNEVITNEAGSFNITGLTPDFYTLVVTNSSFQGKTVGFQIFSDQITTVNVLLQPNPGTLTGSVTDSFTGRPISNASILVFPSQSLTPIAQAVADQAGLYTIAGVAPGEYEVVAAATNFARRGTGALILSNESTIANIQLFPNPATVSGIVSTPEGAPIPNASIQILDQNETVLGSGITDQNGNYAISNLPEGTLTIIASSSGFATQLTAATVTAGQILSNVNIQLNPLSGNLSGKIINSVTGEPIIGAIAIVRTIGGTNIVVSTDTTDTDGNYFIAGLSPGTYSVVGSSTGFGTVTIGAIVQADQTAIANLSLPPLTGSVSGTITDLRGNAITGSNTQIQVFDISGILLKTLLANADGTFNVIDLIPGTYLIQVTALNFATAIASASVAAEQTTNIIVPLTPNPATVTGQVINTQTGAPLSGVIVTITDLNGLILGNSVSDINGQFIIRNLPPNTAVITATATQPGLGSTSTSVQLGPGSTNNVTLFLTPEVGSLTGSIRNIQTSEVIAAATVQVFDFTRALVATLVTDPNGQYLLENITPGTYRVIVSNQNFGTIAQEAVVVVNQETILNFSLTPNPGIILGTILNQQNNQPLGGVGVVVRQFSPAGPVVANSATDGNGLFTIPNLAPGTYTVIATLPNFGTSAASVEVITNSSSTVKLALTPNPGAVQGVVTNAASGAPLPNTFVRVINNNGVIVAVMQTDPNGQYRVQNLEPGTYTMIVINSSFQRQTIGFIVAAGQTNIINVPLEVNPGAVVGTITSAQTGIPLAGATVQLFLSQSLIPVANTVADENGVYHFNGLEPGDYIVTANSTSFARGVLGATVLPNAQTTANISLQPNPVSVSGTITDQNGNPLSNATIRVLDENETVLGTGVSGLDGAYTVGGLPPGTYGIIATKTGFSTITSGLTLVPGEIQTGVNFILVANSGTLTGVVTDSSTGTPLPGVTITIRNILGLVVATAFTNVDGRYTIQNLAPGEYNVSFFENGFGNFVLGAQITTNITTVLNTALSPLVGTIQGQILSEQGTPVTGENIQVKIYNENLVLIRTILSNSDGTFNALDLSPGTYLVNVTAPGFASNTVSAIVRANEQTLTTIRLGTLPATLIGEVINAESGEGIAGSLIIVTRSNGVVIGTAISGENGNFSISNLPAGSFIVTAQNQKFGTFSTGVTLVAGDTTTTLLSLSPNPGRLLGQVTNESTTVPIPGAIIQIFDENRSFVTSVVTDAQGTFTVSNLSPGQYTTVINAVGFGSEFREFMITAEEDTVISANLSPNFGIIQGTVTSLESSQPISSASVVIRALSPAGPIVATTVTDQNGFYQLTGIAPGSYTVIMSGPPIFGSETISIMLDSGEIEIVNLTLTNLPGSVQGKITDEAGIGLTNVLIQLFDEQGSLVRRVQTDNNGNYFIRGFTPGTYKITASQQGFQNAFTNFNVGPEGVATVNLVLLTRPGNINGTIRNAVTNQPIPGAVIQLFPNQSLTPIATTVADQQGNYQFVGLQPGNYRIISSEFNFASASSGSTVISDQTTTTNLFLQPNPASISGIVTTTEGTAINNASIRILDQNETIIGFGVTGPDGRYAISNIPAGTFTIIISAQLFQSQLSSITLNQGESRQDVNFTLLSNPGSITGTVTNINGNPLPGAVITVRILGSTGIVIGSTVTDQGGHYQVSSLAPGSYTVTVNVLGVEAKTAGALVQSNTTTITDFVLTGLTGSISGVILNDLSQPIIGSNVSVSLRDENGILIFTTTANSDGTFSFLNVEPGNYIIVASAAGFINGTVGINVKADRNVFTSLLLQSSPARVTGQVINSVTGEGIQGASVTATSNDGEVIAITTTSEDGFFTIQNLPPGSVVITANAIDFGADSKGIILDSNITSTTILSLDPSPGSLTGSVIGENGQPIIRATVQVFDITNALVSTVITNNFGQYAISGLTPGNYRVVFSAPGFERLAAGSTVIANETTILNVQLDSLFATISGTVINAQTSTPIAGASVTIRYQSASGPLVVTALTDSLGQFVIRGVTEGEVSAVATASGFGAQGLSGVVVAGQTLLFNFQLLHQTAIIQGKVTNNATGDDLINTRIRVINNSGVVIATTQTDINGNYFIPDLSPGFYQVVALNVNFEAQTQNITLVPNQIGIVNFSLLGNPATLRGRVIDAETGLPIIGALVEIFDAFGVPIAFGLTNQEGQYIIEGLPQGLLSVRVSAPGYTSITEQIEFAPNQVVEKNFSLTRPSPILGTIAGQVVDASTNTPITNARIDIVNSQGQLVTFVFTNENGQYVVQGLPSDTYTVFASASNYIEQQQTALIREGEFVFVPVNFQLSRVTRFGTITGQVTNSKTQQPIQGALVEALNAQGKVVSTTRTDESGNFTITGLLPGAYTLRVSAEGFTLYTEQVIVTAGDTTLVSIPLTPKVNVGAIVGIVTNSETNQPIQGARVVVLNGENVVAVGYTDEQGNFIITGIPVGTYIILATAPGFNSESKSVIVEAGETIPVPPFNLTAISNAGSITGRVIDQRTGKPIQGATVFVLKGKDVVAVGYTDEQGNFIITGVPAGTYIILATAPGFNSESKSVIVEAGEIVPVPPFNLTAISNAGSITGRVIDQRTGKPIQGATVFVLKGKDVVAVGYTDEQGNFIITRVPAGTYTILATANGFKSESKSVIVEAGEIVPVPPFNLTAISNAGSITGRVIDQRTGKPIQGATVFVLKGKDVVAVGYTDEQGNFIITGVPAGTYTILATANGFKSETQRVNILVNTTEEINITLIPKLTTITGVVCDIKTGARLPNILIEVLDIHKEFITDLLTDHNGEYTVCELPAGTFNVKASSEDFITELKTITLLPGEIGVVDFALVRRQLFPPEIIIDPQQNNMAFLFGTLGLSSQLSFKSTEIRIKNSHNIEVQLSDNQSATPLQLSLRLAIALILDMIIDNTNDDGSSIQEFIEQSSIKTTEQIIIIDNSKDITIIVDDTDLTANLQILLQILLALLIQIDIL
ncbi:carboxypeptidase regulatory-like domain-containing protein [Priestia megaterium]|uniref:carboxypeptidase regulatory-like domain-containing protein n=1 Tax=Priestia megaterium TaxID=1404 RepID=UPI00300B5B7E